MKRTAERHLHRAAVELRRQLQWRARLEPLPLLPTTCWHTIERTIRKRDIAQGRSWFGAARRLTRCLAGNLAYLRYHIDQAVKVLSQRAEHRPLPTATQLYEELADLDREFVRIQWDYEHDELVATTDTIVLENVELGPFEIRLAVNRPYPNPLYRIVAIDANPPFTDDRVTHPHVRDEELCEGDGREVIRKALAAGRFYEFFLLAAQVLNTYDARSAHVRLEFWNGVACHDCGGMANEEEDLSLCEGCVAQLCAGCARRCFTCDATFCATCLRTCPLCGYDTCEDCFRICPCCVRWMCHDCFEAQRCCFRHV